MANQGAALDVMDLISYLQEEIKLKVVILLWCWSNVRNKTNQGERKYTTEELCSSVLYHSCQMTKLKSASSPSESKHGKWRPPREGFYKINCNGTFLQNSKSGGWGRIIRDHKGAFMAAAAAGHLEFLSSALHAGSLACLKDLELQHLWDEGSVN
jgi:hypothetical protein